MNDRPRITVIMPVYNAANYVGRAIKSALEQEVDGGLEVVVVNDRSTDGSDRVLSALAAADARVRVFENPVNSGAAVSRNRACAEARGDWLAVLDADDAYTPGRLARLLDLAEAENLDALSDLPIFHDLAADEPAATQLEADGRLERLNLAGFLSRAAENDGRLDYGLLKPVFRDRL